MLRLINNPFFSIIIPTYNEEKNLPELLSCLTNQTYKDFEVFIVDNASHDKTKENSLKYIKKISNIHFIDHKSLFVSFARNYGARLAKGKFLIFFDADVVIENNFLKQIFDHIKRDNLDILTVWNRDKEHTIAGKCILFLMNLNLSIFQKIKPAANGPCIIIQRELFNKIKLFDTTIVFGEDFDLIQRGVKNGGRFAVFRKPLLYISTRRFEKEGVALSLYKSIKAIFYQLIFGPIRKPIFEYKMGGNYYENKK